MQKLFADAIKDSKSMVAHYRKQAKNQRAVAAMLKGVNLSDAASVSVYARGETGYSVYLTLKEDKKNSRLVHKLAQHLGIGFTKGKSWNSESLVYNGTSADDNLHVQVAGAVPQTCEIVTREVPLSDEEIAAAVKAIPLVKIVREIKCHGTSEGQEDGL